MSYLGAAICIISTAQQARPKVKGHKQHHSDPCHILEQQYASFQLRSKPNQKLKATENTFGPNLQDRQLWPKPSLRGLSWGLFEMANICLPCSGYLRRWFQIDLTWFHLVFHRLTKYSNSGGSKFAELKYVLETEIRFLPNALSVKQTCLGFNLRA